MARTVVRGLRRGAPVAPVQQKVEIADIVKAIRKDFGDNAILMGDQKRQPRRIPTRIFPLDLAYLGGIMVQCINEFKGAKHSGKGGLETDRVLTPTGWRKYADLKVGDAIIGSNGRATEITGVFPRGELPTYKVSFTDGTNVIVDGDHLWQVQTKKMNQNRTHRILETRALAEGELKAGAGWRYRIPLVKPVEFDAVDLPFDPYTLGVFLANGALSGNRPVFMTNDVAVADEVAARCPDWEVKEHAPTPCLRWYIGAAGPFLKSLGLLGSKSADKSIPGRYFFGTVEQRLALLQGLMDCDGSVTASDGSGHHKGGAKYHTRSPRLAAGMVELVQSLGGIANLFRAERDDGIDFTVSVNLPLQFSPFLACVKKRERFHSRGHRSPVRSIVSVEPAGNAKVICISVAAVDKLYVTENYTVTHNTTACYKVISAAQLMYPDRYCAFVDMEHAFDHVWAAKLGVNVSELLLVQPSSGEEAVDQIQGLMNHPGVCLVVLDSVATLVPMKEVEQATEDQNVGIHAKLVTKMVRKILNALSEASKAGREVTFLCTNQQRAGIGKWAPPGQEAISDPGGKALGHYTVSEAVFKNKETLAKDEDGFDALIVNEHAFQIHKNKWNAGIRKGDFLLRRMGDEELGLVEGDVDDAEAMIGFAKKMGCYTGGGKSWTLTLPDFEETLANKDAWVEHLYTNRDIHTALRNHLIALQAVKLGMPQYVVDSIYEQELP